MELDDGVLGRENLFNLSRHTVRFMPTRAGYRVENLPMQWDPDFGQKLSNHDVTLHNFAFPFSGKTWDSFSVSTTGSIRFGEASNRLNFSGDQSGISIGRFDQLTEGAADLVNTVPAICVFFKLGMSGDLYVKDLRDHVVITWDVTEPSGSIQAFTWTKTVNRFQVALRKNGMIDMSYDQLAARDAIVGVYPLVSDRDETVLAKLNAEKLSGSHSADSLNLQTVKLSVLDRLLLEVTFETAGPSVLPRDLDLSGILFRVYFSAHKPFSGSESTESTAARADAVWTVSSFAPREAGAGARQYFAFGPGVSNAVTVHRNTISIRGLLPSLLRRALRLYVSVDAYRPGSDKPLAHVPPHPVTLRTIRDPEVHLSSLNPRNGPFSVLYEAFHYYALPNPHDLACTVIKALGDKFDFLAYYSDFRVDSQEAGTSSDGPRGALGGAVTGIGAPQRGLAFYCTQGRFQWQFTQPVYVGSNQMQERPPVDVPIGTNLDITFYQKQLGETSQDGKIPPYMYAMSQIAHEMGHRWVASVSAKVGRETISLADPHWAFGLQTPAAFPYRRPTEASIMGGGVWQDNFDGTYSQLDDDYYVPATGYSHLDLYLMGLISPTEVPDFFILRNLIYVGKDVNEHPIYRADRTKATIQDVIAAEGPRSPSVDESQRQFNTGIVIIVQHGAKPSSELIQRAEGIRRQWIDYFWTCTGHRAIMRASPR